MVWSVGLCVSPWNKNALAGAVQSNVDQEARQEVQHMCCEGARFRFREGAGAGIRPRLGEAGTGASCYSTTQKHFLSFS